MTDEQKPTITTTAAPTGEFQLAAVEAPAGNLPLTLGAGGAATAPAASGLSYQNAHEDEKAEIERIMAGIDLTDPTSASIIALGAEERKELADMADKMLDSIDPPVKIKFAEAMKQLMDFVAQNSLAEIKNRIMDRGVSAFRKSVMSVFSKPDPAEEMKTLINKFMVDISGSRKIIREMADNLAVQQVDLDQNFANINMLGAAFQKAEKRMRLVSAATTEFIRRVNAGENTILKDLKEKAQASGRSDDLEAQQMAETNWGALLLADAGITRSIGVYDLNIANMAFTKQANVQNRIQTAMAITNTLAEWKAQLAVFGTGSVEKLAAILLQNVGKMSDKSVQATQDQFEQMMDIVVGNIGGSAVSLRQVVTTQEKTGAMLKDLGDKVNAQFGELASAKAALQQSSAAFRETVGDVYGKGHLGGGVPSTQSASAPKPF